MWQILKLHILVQIILYMKIDGWWNHTAPANPSQFLQIMLSWRKQLTQMKLALLMAPLAPIRSVLGGANHSQCQSCTCKINQVMRRLINFSSTFEYIKCNTESFKANNLEMKVAYFSINNLRCCFSAVAKNSSISFAVGMILCTPFWTPWLVAGEPVRLVMEPGVPMVSQPLMKLHGVLSLVLLHSNSKLTMIDPRTWTEFSTQEHQIYYCTHLYPH